MCRRKKERLQKKEYGVYIATRTTFSTLQITPVRITSVGYEEATHGIQSAAYLFAGAPTGSRRL